MEPPSTGPTLPAGGLINECVHPSNIKLPTCLPSLTSIPSGIWKGLLAAVGWTKDGASLVTAQSIAANTAVGIGSFANLLVSGTCGLFYTAYKGLVVAPLRRLYYHGPAMGGYGFWNGREPSDICAAYFQTGTFWTNNMQACVDGIEKNFEAFMVAVEVLVYFAILIWLFRTAANLFVARYLQPVRNAGSENGISNNQKAKSQ